MQIIVPQQILLISLYFGENLRNYPSIVHFYLRKLEFAPFYREITKRESKSFSLILEYALMPIIVAKQILLMSLYFGEILPNWPSIVHLYLSKLCVCTIFSANHQEGEQFILMDIRVLLNANNRTKADFADGLYFGENLPNCPSIVHFYLRKLYICRILSGNHQEGEPIIFMDVRALLYANNRTEINFSDKPLFWRKSAQLSVYCTFLF